MTIEAKLVVVEGAAEAEIPLKLPTVVGRSGQASLKVRTTVVSREHCKLFERKGALFVEDLNSSNGTFINAEKIDSVTKIASGDFLTVGPVTLKVVYSAAGRELSEDPYTGEQGVLNDVPEDSESESKSHIHYKETIEGSFLGIDDSMLNTLGSREGSAEPEGEGDEPKNADHESSFSGEQSHDSPEENVLFKEKKQENGIETGDSTDSALNDFLNKLD